MKNLLIIILLFFNLTSKSQQVIKLCEDANNIFTYTTQSSIGGTFYWTVNGTAMSSSTDSLIMDWQDYQLGSYDIEVNFSSNNGCPAVPTNYNVTLIECDNSSIFVPNAFTPNGDNVNDTWAPVAYKVTEVNFKVFNRWGELLYESNRLEDGWKGTYNDRDCQNDVYTYVIKWKDTKNKVSTLIGHVTIVK